MRSSGSVAAFPSRTTIPSSSTMQMAVSCSETSSPVKYFMTALPDDGADPTLVVSERQSGGGADDRNRPIFMLHYPAVLETLISCGRVTSLQQAGAANS